MRLDTVLKFKLSKECRKYEGQSVVFSYTFENQTPSQPIS